MPPPENHAGNYPMKSRSIESDSNKKGEKIERRANYKTNKSFPKLK
jgi:hypothetical protein